MSKIKSTLAKKGATPLSPEEVANLGVPPGESIAQGRQQAKDFGKAATASIADSMQTAVPKSRSEQVAEDNFQTVMAGRGRGLAGTLGFEDSIDTGIDVKAEEFDRLVPNITLKDGYQSLADTRADMQPIMEKIGRALKKNTVNFLTAYTGGMAMIGSIPYGLVSAATGGKFSDVYDNAFYDWLDNINDSTIENNQWYINSKEEEYSFLRKLGTSRFWFDEVGHAMSFTAAAVATELSMSALTTATFGAAAPLQLAATARLARMTQKALGKAKKVMPAIGKSSVKAGQPLTKTMEAAKQATTASSKTRQAAASAGKAESALQLATTNLRQLVSGAMYEAGVEARATGHEMDQKFLEEKGLTSLDQLTDEERANYENYKAGVMNSVFAANTAIVGLSNAIVLPTVFDGVKKTLDKAGSAIGLPLSRAARARRKVKVDPKDSGKLKVKPDTRWKARKIVDATIAGSKRALAEGVWEEGSQGLVSEAALEHLASAIDSSTLDSSLSVIDALIEAFGNTYGDFENDEFWNEVGIGAIVGLLGGSSAAPVQATAALLDKNRSVGQALGESLSDNAFFDAVKAYKGKTDPEIIKNVEKANIAIDRLREEMFTISKIMKGAELKDEGLAEKNRFLEKNGQFEMLAAFVQHRHNLGMSKSVIEEMERIKELSAEEFREQFAGYENMTDEEVLEKKNRSADNAIEQAKAYIEAVEQADSFYDGENMHIRSAVQNVFMGTADAEMRLKSIVSELNEMASEMNDEVTAPIIDGISKLSTLAKTVKSLDPQVKTSELAKYAKQYKDAIEKDPANQEKHLAEFKKQTKDVYNKTIHGELEDFVETLDVHNQAKSLESEISKLASTDPNYEKLLEHLQAISPLTSRLNFFRASMDALKGPEGIERLTAENKMILDELRTELYNSLDPLAGNIPGYLLSANSASSSLFKNVDLDKGDTTGAELTSKLLLGISEQIRETKKKDDENKDTNILPKKEPGEELEGDSSLPEIVALRKTLNRLNNYEGLPEENSTTEQNLMWHNQALRVLRSLLGPKGKIQKLKEKYTQDEVQDEIEVIEAYATNLYDKFNKAKATYEKALERDGKTIIMPNADYISNIFISKLSLGSEEAAQDMRERLKQVDQEYLDSLENDEVLIVVEELDEPKIGDESSWANNMSQTFALGARTVKGEEGNKYGVFLYIKMPDTGQLEKVGGIADPHRFKHNNKRVDFTRYNDIETKKALRAMNPVFTNKSATKLTRAGERFIKNWFAMNELFSELLNEEGEMAMNKDQINEYSNLLKKSHFEKFGENEQVPTLENTATNTTINIEGEPTPIKYVMEVSGRTLAYVQIGNDEFIPVDQVEDPKLRNQIEDEFRRVISRNKDFIHRTGQMNYGLGLVIQSTNNHVDFLTLSRPHTEKLEATEEEQQTAGEEVEAKIHEILDLMESVQKEKKIKELPTSIADIEKAVNELPQEKQDELRQELNKLQKTVEEEGEEKASEIQELENKIKEANDRILEIDLEIKEEITPESKKDLQKERRALSKELKNLNRSLSSVKTTPDTLGQRITKALDNDKGNQLKNKLVNYIGLEKTLSSEDAIKFIQENFLLGKSGALAFLTHLAGGKLDFKLTHDGLGSINSTESLSIGMKSHDFTEDGKTKKRTKDGKVIQPYLAIQFEIRSRGGNKERYHIIDFPIMRDKDGNLLYVPQSKIEPGEATYKPFTFEDYIADLNAALIRQYETASKVVKDNHTKSSSARDKVKKLDTYTYMVTNFGSTGLQVSSVRIADYVNREESMSHSELSNMEVSRKIHHGLRLSPSSKSDKKAKDAMQAQQVQIYNQYASEIDSIVIQESDAKTIEELKAVKEDIKRDLDDRVLTSQQYTTLNEMVEGTIEAIDRYLEENDTEVLWDESEDPSPTPTEGQSAGAAALTKAGLKPSSPETSKSTEGESAGAAALKGLGLKPSETQPQSTEEEDGPQDEQGTSGEQVSKEDLLGLINPKTKKGKDREAPDTSEDDTAESQTEPEVLVNKNEAVSLLSKILPMKTEDNPDGIFTLEDIQALSEKISGENTSWGAFKGAVIYLREHASKKGVGLDTAYHEAFHAIFRTFLSDRQVSFYLRAAEKRFGKPTSKQITQFKQERPYLSSKTDTEISHLILEEKLAEGFQKFAIDKLNNKEPKSKGVLRRLFDNLWNKVQSFFNKMAGLEPSIDRLYENIMNGSYANARFPVLRNTTRSDAAFQLLKAKGFTLEDGQLVSLPNQVDLLSSRESKRILNDVMSKAIEFKTRSNSKRLNFHHIQDAIDYYANYVYNPEVWIDDAYVLINSGQMTTAEFLRLAVKLRRFQSALAVDNEVNRTYITQEVIKKYSVFFDTSYEDFMVDDENNQDEDESDIGVPAWAQQNEENQSINKLSRYMREFIAMIPMQTNFFGLPDDIFNAFLTLPREESENTTTIEDRFNSSADAFTIFGMVKRVLADVPEHQMLQRLSTVSGHNTNTRAFYNHLKKQIIKELKAAGKLSDNSINFNESTAADEFSLEQILPYVHHSQTYNAFITEFSKATLNQKFVGIDPNTGESRVFFSNRLDVRDKVFSEWLQTFTRRFTSPKDASDIFRELDLIYESIPQLLRYFAENPGQTTDFELLPGKDEPLFVSSIEEVIDEIQDLLWDAGIEVHRDYIKTSIVKDFAGVVQEIINSDVELTGTEMSETLAENQIIELMELRPQIDSSLLSFRELSDDNSSSLFSILEKITNEGYSPFRSLDSGVTEIVGEGAIGRLKNLAWSNYLFDETLGDSTFQNSENKIIYDKVGKSYITSEVALWRNAKAREFIRHLKNNNFLEAKKAFDGFFSYTIPNELQRDNYYETIIKNPLIKNLDNHQIEAFFENLELFGLDGLKQFDYDDTKADFIEDILKGNHNEGKKYASLDTKSVLITALSMFASGRSTAQNAGPNGLNLTNYILNKFETKNTQFGTKAPVFDFVDPVTGNTKNNAVQFLLDFFQMEYETIQYTQEELELFTEDQLIEGYHIPHPDKPNQKLRGFHFNMFKHIPGITSEAFEEKLEQFRQMALEGVPFEDILESEDNLNQLKDFVQDYIEIQFERFYTTIGGTSEFSSPYLETEKTEDGEVNVGLGEVDSVFNIIFKLTNSDTGVEVDVANAVPSYFIKDGKKRNVQFKEPNKASFKNFFFNHYLNMASVNNIILGNTALSHKSNIDVFKRNGMLNSNGPSVASGHLNVAILREPVYEADTLRLGPLDEKTGLPNPITNIEERKGKNIRDFEPGDGQTYTNTLFLFDQYYTRLGKYEPVIMDEIKLALLSGRPLTASQKSYMDTHEISLQPKKLVYRDKFNMIKTSTLALSRGLTSRIKAEHQPLGHISEVFDKIEEMWKDYYQFKELGDNDKAQQVIFEIQSFYEAIPGRENAHEMLNAMEMTNTSIVGYETAFKGAKFGVQSLSEFTDNFNPPENVILGEYLREQQKTDGLKSKSTDGTQKMSMVWTEISNDVTEAITLFGKKSNFTKIASDYESMLGKRISVGYQNMKRTIINEKGEGYFRNLLNSFHASLESSNAEFNVRTLFEMNEATGEPKFNLNHPGIDSKYQAMFLAYVGANTIKHKASGTKFTLASEVEGLGNVMLDKDGNVTYRKTNAVSSRRLHFRKRDPNHPDKVYSEIAVSQAILDKMGLKIGDAIKSSVFEDVLKLSGVRIPTQDRQSMGTLRIANVLPYEYGNIIVMPSELVYLSGADFDIDALYARMFGITEGLPYGEYLDSKKPIERAYTEYLSEQKSNQTFQAVYRKIKLRPSFNKALAELEEKISALSELGETDSVTPLLEALKDVGVEIKDDDKFKSTNVLLEEAAKAKRSLIKEVKALREALVAEALREIGAIDSLDKFKEQYGRIVDNNRKAFKKGEIANIIPITTAESSNLLLEMELNLIHNYTDQNYDVSTVPVSERHVDEVIEELEELDLLPEEETFGIASPLDLLVATQANNVGARGIGPVANATTLFGVLSKYQISTPMGHFIEIGGNGEVIIHPDTKKEVVIGRFLDDRSVSDKDLTYIGEKRLDGKVENKEGERVRDILNSIISTMLDNPSLRKASKINLSIEALGPVLMMVMQGVSHKTALKIPMLPMVSKFMQFQEASKSPVLSEFDKRRYAVDLPAEKGLINRMAKAALEVIPESLITDELQTTLFAGDLNEAIEILGTSDTIDLANDINNILDPKDTKYDTKQKVIAQLVYLEKFRLGIEIAKKTNQVQDVMKLMKGFKPSFSDNLDTKEAITNIYRALETISNGKSLPDVFIQNSLSSPLISSLIKAFSDIMDKVSPEFFINNTPYAQEVEQFGKALLRPGSLGYKDTYEKFRKEFLGYVATQGAMNILRRFHQGKKPDPDFNMFFNSEVFAILNEVREKKENAGLAITKALRTVEYDGARSLGNFKDKIMYILSTNTRRERDVEYLQEIGDELVYLMHKDQDSPEYQLGLAILYTVMLKDNFMYKSGGLVSLLPPSILENAFSYFQVLGLTHNLFKDKGSSKETINVTDVGDVTIDLNEGEIFNKYNLPEDFLLRFLLHPSNIRSAPGGKLNYVVKRVQASMRAAYTGNELKIDKKGKGKEATDRQSIISFITPEGGGKKQMILDINVNRTVNPGQESRVMAINAQALQDAGLMVPASDIPKRIARRNNLSPLLKAFKPIIHIHDGGSYRAFALKAVQKLNKENKVVTQNVVEGQLAQGMKALYEETEFIGNKLFNPYAGEVSDIREAVGNAQTSIREQDVVESESNLESPPQTIQRDAEMSKGAALLGRILGPPSQKPTSPEQSGTPDQSGLSKGAKKLGKLLGPPPKQKQYKSSAESISRKKAETLLNGLSEKFNIPWEYQSLGVNGPRAFYQDGKVVINSDVELKADTPFHEFLHPFEIMIMKKNPELHTKLMDELAKLPEFEELYASIYRDYHRDFEEATSHLSPEKQRQAIHQLVMREAFVQKAGELAADLYSEENKQKGGFFEALRQFFKELFSGLTSYSEGTYSLDPSTLSQETSIEDIARLMFPNNNSREISREKGQVKEGVPEIFNENPELANAVYEAAGFSKNISLDDAVGKTFTIDTPIEVLPDEIQKPLVSLTDIETDTSDIEKTC